MDPNTIETPLSYVQLLTELRRDYIKIKENLIKLKSTKGIGKIPQIEETAKYPTFAAAAATKIQAKLALEAKAVAQLILKQINQVDIYDTRQVDMWIKPAFDRLLRTLEKIKKDAEADLLKSKALIRMMRQSRVDVWRMKKKTIRVARAKVKQRSLQLQAAQQKTGTYG